LQELQEILHLLAKLVEEHGWWQALAFLAIALGIPWARDWRRERKEDQRVDRLLAAKDEVIERLAESDRFWRAYFLRREGRTPDEIERIMGRPPPAELPSGAPRNSSDEKMEKEAVNREKGKKGGKHG
jgi:hypothetical protein